MKMIAGLLVIGTASALLAMAEGQSNGSKPYKVVCYLGSWANYRPGKGRFVIEDIDPFLCTHLIYGFAKLGNDNRIAAYDPYLDLRENWGLGAYERFNNLKKQNSELKTLLAIGGWNEGSTKYSEMAANPRSRKTFINSCVQFLEKYGFDGLDMDWEYPANRGGIPEDKQNFATLLKELKQAFVDHHLMLTAAVSAGKNTTDSAYDVPAISRYLDFINLMTYDFHGGWDTVTGLNAPLYPSPSETGGQTTLNVDFAVNYWLKKGAPAKKLVLGMAFYGRTFTLQNPRPHGIGAPVSGRGTAGPYTRESGMLGYNEICAMLDGDPSWREIFDGDQQAPYAFKDRQWVGFDNMESIALKVEYIRTKKLGGGMVWSLETDDFKSQCGDGNYPLLTIVTKDLNGLQIPSTTTTATTTVTSSTGEPTEALSKRDVRKESSTEEESLLETDDSGTTEDTSPSEELCTEAGYMRDEDDCTKFYYCKPKEPSGFYIYSFHCGPGTYYSHSIKGCDFPHNVPECKS